MKEAIAKAVGTSPSIKLYFPSEFGVDHMLGEGKDKDFAHKEWKKKQDHLDLVKRSEAKGKELKICSVYVSLLPKTRVYGRSAPCCLRHPRHWTVI